MTPIETLLALEEVKTVRIRFCRLLDSRQWRELEALMLDKSELELVDETGSGTFGTNARQVVKGRSEIIALMKAIVGDEGRIVHIATMPEITFDDDNNATGIWRLEGYGVAAAVAGKCGIGYETLRETYVRIDGKWRIRNISATFEALI